MSLAAQLRDPRAHRRALLRRLRLLQLRLWSEGFARGATGGLCYGLAAALAAAVARNLQPGLIEPTGLVLVTLVGLALGALWSLLRPPSLLRTARTADARFGLEARLGTAVELLHRAGSGPLGEMQLADAADALRGARGRWPLPFSVAWRQAVLAASLALALAGTLQLDGSDGREGPLLVGLLPGRGPALSPEQEEREPLAEPAAPANAPNAAGQPSGKTAAALRTLDELRRAREAGAVGGDRAARTLDQVESSLDQQAAEARGQHDTLDRLTRALSQVSAAEPAAESIQQGDYARAADQLAQLGQESDQLSAEAKSQLSQALRRAAAESSTNAPLADRERRAADALAGRDYQATQSALSGLGQEVARAAGQATSQKELGDAMQQVQRERAANSAGDSAGDRTGREDPSRAQDPASTGSQEVASGQSGGSQAGRGEGNGRDDGAGSQGLAEAGGQNGRRPLPDGPAEKSSQTDLGPSAPPLDVVGKPAEVPVRPGGGADRGPQTDQANGDEQQLDVAQTSFESSQATGPVQAGGQAEHIVVPGDQRQVVRDYFGKRNGRGTP